MSDPADIPGWQRLGPSVTTSGRLRAEDVDRLAGIGVGHVINLALDDHPEALADEAGKLAAAGIGYTHVPVPFEAPEDAHFAAFESAVDAANGPVHVHCIMNWRVAAFFYRRHIAQGMPEEEARALMRQQWDPLASEDPRAKVWAEFLARD